MGRHIIEEAKRCLQCKNAQCTKGCPVSTPLPEIIGMLLSGRIQDAGKILFENNPLSVICSLICPHEKFCEGHCILNKKGTPVHTSDIENYISRYYLERVDITCTEHKDKRIAVIGAGPAGLSVAIIMSLKGYDVTIFESHDKIGGILRYGIPDYRLPKDLLDKLKQTLLDLGVKIRPNILIGSVITVDDLFNDDFKAIFIGTGVWKPRPLKIPGETLGNVHYALHYLKNPGVYDLGKNVTVIGAGNVAMDAARTTLRNGAQNVTILYRRGEKDMSATPYEIEYAKVDGVNFEFYKSPVKIIEKGVIYNETVEEEVDGKKALKILEDREGLVESDSVIIAVSQSPQSNIVSTTEGININNSGLVITDQCGRTTREGVFASGDVVTGAKTVVEAVKYAKKSAQAIEAFLENNDTNAPCT